MITIRKTVALVMALMLVLSLGGALAEGKMTDVGTPRVETLVVDNLGGRNATPDVFNWYLPSCTNDHGLRELILEPLWDVDSMTGTQFPVLAETMAIPDETNTVFTVKLREGITWADGVPFTADDVVFTAQMIINNPTLYYSPSFCTLVKDVRKVDDYTVEIETHAPEYRLEQQLGVAVVATSFNIVPKHIWENEDPNTFMPEKPYGTGPYYMSDYDPDGNWFLYQRREDFQDTATYKLFGEPDPKYVLFRTYGSEENLVMAAINNEIDIMCDITPESWEILARQNEESHAWFSSFPYADVENPCARGLMFNAGVAPFDNVNVRWALTLAVDLKTVAVNAYSGMIKAACMPIPSTTALTGAYYEPMLDWLNEFELSDGYKPFNDRFAFDLVELLETMDVQDLPQTDEEIISAFGVGWWKNDVAEAEKLLIGEGFTKKDGKWYLPSGEKWQINVSTQSGWEVLSERLSYAVVDMWQRFGIDVVAMPLDNNTLFAAVGSGDYQVASVWPTITVAVDSTTLLRQWHQDSMVPIGEIAPYGGNSPATARWKNEKVSSIIDELLVTPGTSDQIVPLTTEMLKEFVTEMPYMSLTNTSKYTPIVQHYWKNIQSAENPHACPWWWTSNFKYAICQYEATGNTN